MSNALLFYEKMLNLKKIDFTKCFDAFSPGFQGVHPGPLKSIISGSSRRTSIRDPCITVFTCLQLCIRQVESLRQEHEKEEREFNEFIGYRWDRLHPFISTPANWISGIRNRIFTCLQLCIRHVESLRQKHEKEAREFNELNRLLQDIGGNSREDRVTDPGIFLGIRIRFYYRLVSGSGQDNLRPDLQLCSHSKIDFV